VSRRHGELPVCGVGAGVQLDPPGAVTTARIALCGVGPRPLRARTAETALAGAQPSEVTLAEVAVLAVADTDPTSDCHGSASFRRHLAGVLTRRALTAAAGRAQQSESHREEQHRA
jgi:carbon-monoxide dehydrogenase medium subunit